ncbi:esterase, partial [Parabacteroides sp. OttesenSCG-928-G21]|nr:esterase [Parabacteroides sp. OttesenSCG-928-G21]
MKKVLAILLTCMFVFPAIAQELVNVGSREAIVSPEFSGNKVTFRFSAPNAKEVKLYGSWMAAYTDTETLTKNSNGVWELTINTPAPEIYTYNFL